MSANVRKPEPGWELEEVGMVACREFAGDDEVEAYHSLLASAMRGNMVPFTRADGVEAQWRVVEPVLGNAALLYAYEPGTWGPGKPIDSRPTTAAGSPPGGGNGTWKIGQLRSPARQREGGALRRHRGLLEVDHPGLGAFVNIATFGAPGLLLRGRRDMRMLHHRMVTVW